MVLWCLLGAAEAADDDDCGDWRVAGAGPCILTPGTRHNSGDHVAGL